MDDHEDRQPLEAHNGRDGQGAGPAEEGAEAPTAMEKVIGLQKETHAILARLDTVEKSLRQARRDHQKQPPKLAASNIRADIAKRMENIGNIDSQIEFVKQKMERDRQESEYARERFAKMEKSITNSEQHVKNLEALLKEIPDD